jgi:hypothetical protein
MSLDAELSGFQQYVNGKLARTTARYYYDNVVKMAKTGYLIGEQPVSSLAELVEYHQVVKNSQVDRDSHNRWSCAISKVKEYLKTLDNQSPKPVIDHGEIIEDSGTDSPTVDLGDDIIKDDRTTDSPGSSLDELETMSQCSFRTIDEFPDLDDDQFQDCQDLLDPSTKLSIITKPTQSGKTFVMIDYIAQRKTASNAINIIFTDNKLLDGVQLSNRMTGSGNQLTVKSLNSQKGNKTTPEEIELMFDNKNLRALAKQPPRDSDLDVLIVCRHATRIRQIREILKRLSSGATALEVNIWIDEADKYFTMFHSLIGDALETSLVANLFLVTATPRAILDLCQEEKLRIKNFFESDDLSTTLPTYSFFREQEIRELSGFRRYDSIARMADKVFRSVEFPPGSVVLVPGEIRKTSHLTIKDVAARQGFETLIVNGDGVALHQQDGTVRDYNQEKRELQMSELLAKIYQEQGLASKRLVITGRLCIGRGITLISEQVRITHAVFSDKLLSNCDEAYQAAGRITGNYKSLPGFRKCQVFCSRGFARAVALMEARAKRFAEYLLEQSKRLAESEDYRERCVADAN